MAKITAHAHSAHKTILGPQEQWLLLFIQLNLACIAQEQVMWGGGGGMLFQWVYININPVVEGWGWTTLELDSGATESGAIVAASISA